MNAFQFDTEMDRLRAAFNAGQFYNQERVKMIWKIIEGLPEFAFRKMVNYFIETQRHAPTPQDFRKAAYEHRKKNPQANQPDEPTIFDMWGCCAKCNSIGYVWIIAGLEKLIARCHCEWGQDAAWQELPVWGSVIRDEWSLKQMRAASFNPHTPDLGADPRTHHKVIEWKNLCQESIKGWQQLGAQN